jgi:hypothetical protein
MQKMALRAALHAEHCEHVLIVLIAQHLSQMRGRGLQCCKSGPLTSERFN